jgi:hypothetical protein
VPEEPKLGQRHEWSPPWALHVEGWYHDRLPPEEPGLPPEAAPWGATCTTCGETIQRTCASGMMRGWIQSFARAHLHRSPLDEAPRKDPNT